MDELARLMDWDLQAIAKGCTNEENHSTTIMDNLHLNYSHLCSEQQDLFSNFLESSNTTPTVDELQELYKPFYPVLMNNPISMVTSSLSIPEETEEVKVLKLKPADKVAAQQDSRCKRSKKNEKKRVKQVTEAEGFCDGWAWRKYGQKPIKGSPYPRSYYRCSSSKGCLARKQVERSHLDPQVFIVTYTAEHCHIPIQLRKKNSQASGGSTRKNTTSSMVASSMMVEDGHVPSVEQSEGVEKDAEGGNWFTNVELEEQLKGLIDDQSLAFMDTFDETWFNSSIHLT